MSYVYGKLFVAGGAGDKSVKLSFPVVDRGSLVRIKRLECAMENPTQTVDCGAGLSFQRCVFRLQQNHDEMDIEPFDNNCVAIGQFDLKGDAYDDTRQSLVQFWDIVKEVKVRGYFLVTGDIYLVSYSSPDDTELFYKVEYDIKPVSLAVQVQLMLAAG